MVLLKFALLSKPKTLTFSSEMSDYIGTNTPNMLIATMSVVIMGYLSANPFYGFILIMTSIFLITLMLLIIFKRREPTLLQFQD